MKTKTTKAIFIGTAIILALLVFILPACNASKTDDSTTVLSGEEFLEKRKTEKAEKEKYQKTKIVSITENLIIFDETDIVYICYDQGAGRSSTTGLAEFKSNNGFSCRYDFSSGTLVEMVPIMTLQEDGTYTMSHKDGEIIALRKAIVTPEEYNKLFN